MSVFGLICRLSEFGIPGLLAGGLTLMDSSHCNYQRSSGHHTSQLSGRGLSSGSPGREGGRERGDREDKVGSAKQHWMKQDRIGHS